MPPFPTARSSVIPHPPVTRRRRGCGRVAARDGDAGDTVTRRGGRRDGVPLGTVCGARSGDKGGNANVGLWARDDDAFELARSASRRRRMFHACCPRRPDLEVRRYRLPNLRALNFVVVGHARRRRCFVRCASMRKPKVSASTSGLVVSTSRCGCSTDRSSRARQARARMSAMADWRP